MKKEKVKKRINSKGVNVDLLQNDYRPGYDQLLGPSKILNKRKIEPAAVCEEIEEIYYNAPFGYYSLDDQGYFLLINNTALRWLQQTREDLPARKKFTDILTADSKEKFSQSYPAFMEAGMPEAIELEFVRKDGSSFPVLINTLPVFDEEGNYKMSRSAVLDISNRVSAEKELHAANDHLRQENKALCVANENLQLISREKDRFIDIAIHDLQLPLVSISMLSETLVKENIPSGSEAERRVFEMIHDASVEMKSLLANYLSANLSQTGRMDLFLSEINLSLLVCNIKDRFTPIAAKKNICIHFENSKHCRMYSDRECCTHIIENLLSNAIKYTAPGKNVTVSISCNKNEVKITVADEGPGIRDEERPLLFQRFQKLSARPTGGELSTGLGLSIVKYLVEQLNGNITVESEVGKGSAFIVQLPAAKKI